MSPEKDLMDSPKKPFWGVVDFPEKIQLGVLTNRLLIMLKENNIHRENLLFTGISDVDWKVVLENGADSANRRETYAYTEEECGEKGPWRDDPFYKAVPGRNPCVLVYDGSKLTKKTNSFHQYEFKEGIIPLGAIVAVFKIQRERK